MNYTVVKKFKLKNYFKPKQSEDFKAQSYQKIIWIYVSSFVNSHQGTYIFSLQHKFIKKTWLHLSCHISWDKWFKNKARAPGHRLRLISLELSATQIF
jgi:hypothetical protein